jgi:hypothetical protein
VPAPIDHYVSRYLKMKVNREVEEKIIKMKNMETIGSPKIADKSHNSIIS